jgi:putative ABC transport system substrate-binding protein
MSIFVNITRTIILAMFLMATMPDIIANEKPKKIFMIHWLKVGRTALGETFIKYLKEKNLNVEFIERFAEQNKQKLEEFIAEAKQIRPDLIYVYSTGAVLGVAGPWDAIDPKKHITDIPIVAVAHSEPVATKIIKDIGVPTGRNVTGVGHHIPNITSLKIMQSFSDNIKKIVVLSSPEPNSVAGGLELKKIAATEKVETALVQFEVKDNKIVEGGIKKAVLKVLAEKPDMIYLPSDGVTQGSIRLVIDEFIQNKSIRAAPIYTTLEDMVRVEGACLFAYFTSFAVMGLMAGMQAEDILFKGKDVKTMPYQIGSKTSLAIREDTMNALGTTPKIALLETAEIFRKVASNG